MAERVKVKGNFDKFMSKYAELQPKEIEVHFEGEKLKIAVRELSWSEILQCVDHSYIPIFEGHQATSRMFEFDRYWRKVVAKAICTPPFNDEVELMKISPSFAQLLQSLLPQSLWDMGKSGGSDPKDLKSSADKLKP